MEIHCSQYGLPVCNDSVLVAKALTQVTLLLLPTEKWLMNPAIFVHPVYIWLLVLPLRHAD